MIWVESERHCKLVWLMNSGVSQRCLVKVPLQMSIHQDPNAKSWYCMRYLENESSSRKLNFNILYPWKSQYTHIINKQYVNYAEHGKQLELNYQNNLWKFNGNAKDGCLSSLMHLSLCSSLEASYNERVCFWESKKNEFGDGLVCPGCWAAQGPRFLFINWIFLTNLTWPKQVTQQFVGWCSRECGLNPDRENWPVPHGTAPPGHPCAKAQLLQAKLCFVQSQQR